MKTLKYNLVNVPGDNNRRAMFYGWNNLTDYEREAIRNVKEWIWKNKQVRTPSNVSDRDILKFIQADFFVIDKIGEKLSKHYNWLSTLPNEPTLNAKSFRLL